MKNERDVAREWEDLMFSRSFWNQQDAPGEEEEMDGIAYNGEFVPGWDD